MVELERKIHRRGISADDRQIVRAVDSRAGSEVAAAVRVGDIASGRIVDLPSETAGGGDVVEVQRLRGRTVDAIEHRFPAGIESDVDVGVERQLRRVIEVEDAEIEIGVDVSSPFQGDQVLAGFGHRQQQEGVRISVLIGRIREIRGPAGTTDSQSSCLEVIIQTVDEQLLTGRSLELEDLRPAGWVRSPHHVGIQREYGSRIDVEETEREIERRVLFSDDEQVIGPAFLEQHRIDGRERGLIHLRTQETLDAAGSDEADGHIGGPISIDGVVVQPLSADHVKAKDLGFATGGEVGSDGLVEVDRSGRTLEVDQLEPLRTCIAVKRRFNGDGVLTGFVQQCRADVLTVVVDKTVQSKTTRTGRPHDLRETGRRGERVDAGRDVDGGVVFGGDDQELRVGRAGQ